ncbi:male sterility protein-domain-containing protein [Hypoxylon fragiforme]|uniref:male sterility protein-domain-containing protein n=1 Tax=Hypoxylon fragiforme TaxID=63214 RepID=UPI0020C695BC|nr:male sterility protein-domain-containing protein [Hypoxylon fragiforme]KAI2613746.1 male sterility protein-domain-containing protein [Hypoxylon fragiforme]
MAWADAIGTQAISSGVRNNGTCWICKYVLLKDCGRYRPQLDVRAIEHLCDVSNMTTIMVDDSQADIARQLRSSIRTVKIPSFPKIQNSRNEYRDNDLSRSASHDVAYLRHTSGTSSGLPKPIVQTQWGVVGCLPSFPHPKQPATFSTTPLYHGGLADCFRAWTSGAMIWLFSEGRMPITGRNVIDAVAYARSQSSAAVKYFSSVPYVVQMLADEPEGLRLLQSMDLVGVGGAALTPSVGDELVEAGVKLVSRMGSAECGFLMSSHRDYAEDKEWQYLRPIVDSTYLSFEPRGDGLSELVVKPSWPLISKTNRDDGSYATSDLFEAHPSIPNAWRYHSRADAQIVLANGKKFDPSPMEEVIKASSPLIQDVLVFGTGKPYAGALLFKASDDPSDEDVINAAWPTIHLLNGKSQGHSRLARSMLVVVKLEDEDPIAKSSKGTILRRQAEARFANLIERSYESKRVVCPKIEKIEDSELTSVLKDLFAQILGWEADIYQDLFGQGVDSIACIQVKKLIESTMFPEKSPRLPTNIIYDSGSISVLCENLNRIKRDGCLRNTEDEIGEWELMRDLSEKYGDFTSCSTTCSAKKHGDVVVLTGATGTLGAHILSTLCRDVNIRKVYCLLRSQLQSTPKKRMADSLSRRGLSGEDKIKGGKVVSIYCELSKPHLGLSDEDWTRIITESTTFIHVAWSVNFSLPLGSQAFVHHIAGTREMIKAAVASGARFVFVSSTAAVNSVFTAIIKENVSQDPSHASPLGYARSKWVAEQICSSAYQQLPDASISIVRVGQLCGNEAGVWNMSESYPLILSTASLAGCLPDLRNQSLNWLPVDQAASAVLEITLSAGNGKRESSPDMPVYHVLNPYRSPSWSQLLCWISHTPGSSEFEIVEPAEWLRRVESALGSSHAKHPSQALLGFWRGRYSDCQSKTVQLPSQFEIDSTLQSSPTMRGLKPLGRDEVVGMWDWIQENAKKL